MRFKKYDTILFSSSQDFAKEGTVFEAESCWRSEAIGVWEPLKGPGGFWIFNAQIDYLPDLPDLPESGEQIDDPWWRVTHKSAKIYSFCKDSFLSIIFKNTFWNIC